MKNLNPLKNPKPDTGLFIEKPEHIGNKLQHGIGLLFMVLNKIRHEVKGYTSARGFSSNFYEKALEHNFNVAKRWQDYLIQYDSSVEPFKGKNILELGPGADLGVGLITLAEGAKNYYSLDVHNMVINTPQGLYDYMFEFLAKVGYSSDNVENLKRQLSLQQEGQSDQLNYVCRKDFDLTIFEKEGIDLIVSNAAFQQFDYPFQTIEQMSKITQSGARFIALIDLQTHTRWIKAKDPLNIYRYQNSIYNALRFSGSPNRIRPHEYQEVLQDFGWTDIKIFPRILLEKSYVEKIQPTLEQKFREPFNNMDHLTVIICATKK